MRPTHSPRPWRTGRSHAGFSLIELLLVVAILGILAAIAIPSLLRARLSGNEASAIASLRTISSAQQAFSATCGGGGFAATLEDLATPPAESAPFIAADLGAAGVAGIPKSGYVFGLDGTGSTVMTGSETCNESSADTRTGFFATADPSEPGVTGSRHFAIDQSGQVRQADIALTDITSGIALQ